ncbi:hypothetical protein JW977_03755 [Candidatus Falkowbacteria bacterium]|nr:hypothetical protein [Candidatus Falkowbacteria bacterium]
MAEEIQTESNKKRKFIWLLLFLLLIIIAVILYLILARYNIISGPINVNINNQNINEPATVPVTTTPTFNTPDSTILSQMLDTAPIVIEVQKSNAVFTASTFAERFGSYSNQSNYKNLDELTVFMTDSMIRWINQTYKPSLIAQNPQTNAYYALETKAISSQINLLDEDANASEILIKTQRQEFKNSISNPRIFYQDILIKMIKIGDEWKVDGAYWQ